MRYELILMIVVVVLFAIDVNAGLLDRIVLYTKMNDSSITDEVRSFDGTEDSTADTLGKIERARQCGATDTINWTASPNIFGTNPVAWTCAAWVNQSDTGGGDVINDYTGRDGGDNHFGLEWYTWHASPHDMHIYIRNVGTSYVVNKSYVGASSSNDDLWIFYAQVVNRTEGIMRLYVNGTEVDNTSIADANYFADQGDGDGLGEFHGCALRSGDAWATFFAGDIDEIGCWNRSLSAAEINTLWNNSAGSTHDFGEGAAVTVCVDENFDDGNDDGWTDSGSLYSPSETQSNSPTWSEFYNSAGASNVDTLTWDDTCDLSDKSSANATFYGWSATGTDADDFCCIDIHNGTVWDNGTVDSEECVDGGGGDPDETWIQFNHTLDADQLVASAKVRIRCEGDNADDFFIDDINLTFITGEVDSTPPVIQNIISTSADPSDSTEPYLSGLTETPTFTLDTDEAATCGMSDVNNTYTEFGTTGDLNHTGTLAAGDALSCTTGFNQTVFFNCTDGSSNSRTQRAIVTLECIPTLDYNNTTPDSPNSTVDILFNMTCSDINPGDTIAGFVQLYNQTVAFEPVKSNASLVNGTNTLIYTLDSLNTTDGETWTGEYWCGDGGRNTTKVNDSVTITDADACTLSTIANTFINCSDSCDFLATDVGGFNVTLNGTGTVVNVSNINNFTKIRIQEGCTGRA